MSFRGALSTDTLIIGYLLLTVPENGKILIVIKYLQKQMNIDVFLGVWYLKLILFFYYRS